MKQITPPPIILPAPPKQKTKSNKSTTRYARDTETQRKATEEKQKQR
jgi:hypothetical protein